MNDITVDELFLMMDEEIVNIKRELSMIIYKKK